MADITRIKDEIAQDEKPATVPIFQKNGEHYLADNSTPENPAFATIDVLGSDSRRVISARDALQRKLLRSRKTKLEPEDVRANRIDFAAAAITGWSGWTNAGKPFECTPENARILLRVEHILTQVEEAIDSHSDFFLNASSS